MTTAIRETVEAAVQGLLQTPGVRAGFDLLRSGLPSGTVPLVVGGAIRNLVIDILWGNPPVTPDIDIFIDGLSKRYDFGSLFAGQRFEVTELGGVRWVPPACEYAFDLCALSSFIVLEKSGLAPSVPHLLDCLDFSVNAVIYDTAREVLHEKGCIAAVQRREIDFNAPLYFSKLLIAYRALLIRHKTGFHVSEPVFEFLKYQLDLDTLKDLKKAFRSKTGEPMAKAVMEDYDTICSFKNHHEYLDALGRSGSC
ncbi:MAG: hypothetical protein ACOWWM_20165 [Desulfobacterales bacterium]